MGDSQKHVHGAISGSHLWSGSAVFQELGYYAKRLVAIGTLLEQKGIYTSDELQGIIASLGDRSALDGARIVARAWVDHGFKERLLADARVAIKELGYLLTSDLVVVENTDDLHHVVVCTLCSCYPVSLLGQPPDWYKSNAYRSRVVADPRGVVKEFGLELEPGVQIRVVDSTADVRYMVLPQQPPRTDHLSEAALADLVDRDSLIGTSIPYEP